MNPEMFNPASVGDPSLAAGGLTRSATGNLEPFFEGRDRSREVCVRGGGEAPEEAVQEDVCFLVRKFLQDRTLYATDAAGGLIRQRHVFIHVLVLVEFLRRNGRDLRQHRRLPDHFLHFVLLVYQLQLQRVPDVLVIVCLFQQSVLNDWSMVVEFVGRLIFLRRQLHHFGFVLHFVTFSLFI